MKLCLLPEAMQEERVSGEEGEVCPGGRKLQQKDQASVMGVGKKATYRASVLRGQIPQAGQPATPVERWDISHLIVHIKGRQATPEGVQALVQTELPSPLLLLILTTLCTPVEKRKPQSMKS